MRPPPLRHMSAKTFATTRLVHSYEEAGKKTICQSPYRPPLNICSSLLEATCLLQPCAKWGKSLQHRNLMGALRQYAPPVPLSHYMTLQHSRKIHKSSLSTNHLASETILKMLFFFQDGCITASEPHIAPPHFNYLLSLDAWDIRAYLVCSGPTMRHA